MPSVALLTCLIVLMLNLIVSIISIGKGAHSLMFAPAKVATNQEVAGSSPAGRAIPTWSETGPSSGTWTEHSRIRQPLQ